MEDIDKGVNAAEAAGKLSVPRIEDVVSDGDKTTDHIVNLEVEVEPKATVVVNLMGSSLRMKV